MKKIIVLLSLCFLTAACQSSSPAGENNAMESAKSLYNQTLIVKNKKISVEVVTTSEDMQKGLSGRQKLTDEQGMLFDFKTPQATNFWMKDMLFDLDLIWIRNKKIVGITDNVPFPKKPSDPLPVYSPPGEVDMVLEVNGGWSQKYGVKVGDKIIEQD